MNNKKVAILSRHAVPNYGSVFQAYSLQTVLENIGYKAEHINYVDEKEKTLNHIKLLIKGTKWEKSFFLKLVFYLYHVPDLAYTRFKFSGYYKNLLNLSKKTFNNQNELRDEYPAADVYCTGSDQVWNIMPDKTIDESYFFDFLKDTDKRISYAASFGKDYIDELNIDRIGTMLGKYNKISVREDSGVKILTDLGLKGDHVLDPTLLLSKELWEKFAMNVRKKNEKYILIYQLNKNDDLNKFAIKISQKLGLKIIRINASISQIRQCGKLMHCPSLKEFVWFIKNAEFFVTDSFHGTAFSLNLNVPFAVFLPRVNTSRISSILKLVDLEDRIIDNPDDISILDKKIDFDKTNRVIEKERNNSINWLVDALRS